MNTLWKKRAVVMAATLLSFPVWAADWENRYNALSEDEQLALHDDEDADGNYIGSRYQWIRDVERYERSNFQTDAQIWAKVNTLGAAAGLDAMQRQEMFNSERRRVDRRNLEIDQTIDRLFADESGDYRRQLDAENEQIVMQGERLYELSTMQYNLITRMIETHGEKAAEAAYRQMLSEWTPMVESH